MSGTTLATDHRSDLVLRVFQTFRYKIRFKLKLKHLLLLLFVNVSEFAHWIQDSD